MPHVIAYTRVDGEPAFVVGPIRYKGRKCGDEEFNPSFNEGNINNVHFYRNRLGLPKPREPDYVSGW